MPGESASLDVKARRGLLGDVVAWVDSPNHRARLIDALRNDASLALVRSPSELRELLRSEIRPANVVILPAIHADGEPTDRLVRQIAGERPRSAIVAWCQAAEPHEVDLRALTIAGVHQFLMSGFQESAVVLRAALLRARRTNAAEALMQSLGGVLPAALHPIVEPILERPAAVTTIGELADAIGVHRKTLFNRCERCGPLTPTELLGWARLAVVAFHLETTRCTVETLALELGYPSSATLRNTVKRYTGCRASELRAGGAIGAVLAALERRLAAEAVATTATTA